MSSDTDFSTLSYPALRSAASDSRDDQARISGHAAGYAAGLREAEEQVAARIAALEAETAAALSHGRARVDHAIAVLNSAASALDLRTVPLLESAHTTLALGALQIAEAVIGSELGDAAVAARSALHRALDSVEVGLVRTVRLNPADLSTLGPDVLEATGVTFTADATLARGDAVTEFPDGYLDARIGTALARVKTAIEEARS
ncbi:FliH/SctL family protein [Conyzicola sp.]|uniref:FliH/SctL family protein n=1 Tax=Conyzicola sp. TaxID=1969404 RepID=UPI00398A3406